MHRTQISLEDEQYVALKERARRTGKSMGQIVRESLDQALGGQSGTKSKASTHLQKLAGLFQDPDLDARDHDRVLCDER